MRVRENCLPRGITTRVGRRKNEAIFAGYAVPNKTKGLLVLQFYDCC